MVTFKPSEEAQKFAIYIFYVSGNPRFSRQVWVGGINKDRMEVLIYRGSGVRDFRGINESWRILHHQRVGGATTAAA